MKVGRSQIPFPADHDSLVTEFNLTQDCHQYSRGVPLASRLDGSHFAATHTEPRPEHRHYMMLAEVASGRRASQSNRARQPAPLQRLAARKGLGSKP